MEYYIKEIEYFDFIMNSADSFPESIRYHAALAWRSQGVIFAAFQEDSAIGLCILNQLGNKLDVMYLFVQEVHRRKGIASALLMHCTHYSKKTGRKLNLRVIKENDFAEILMKLADRSNFRTDHTTSIFITDSKEEIYWEWEKLNSQKEKVYHKLFRNRYETRSFTSAPDEVIQRLKEEIGINFPHYLNPFNLQDRNDDWSFITYQGNKPVAFSAASLIGTKLIFQQLASRYDYRNRGVFLLPVYYYFDCFFARPGYRMNCIVLDDNERMQRLMNKFFKPLIEQKKHQISMVYES